MVGAMCKDVRGRLRAVDWYSDKFGVEVGVNQGSVLRPHL